jgi:hypothetical protein
MMSSRSCMTFPPMCARKERLECRRTSGLGVLGYNPLYAHAFGRKDAMGLCGDEYVLDT